MISIGLTLPLSSPSSSSLVSSPLVSLPSSSSVSSPCHYLDITLTLHLTLPRHYLDSDFSKVSKVRKYIHTQILNPISLRCVLALADALAKSQTWWPLGFGTRVCGHYSDSFKQKTKPKTKKQKPKNQKANQTQLANSWNVPYSASIIFGSLGGACPIGIFSALCDFYPIPPLSTGERLIDACSNGMYIRA